MSVVSFRNLNIFIYIFRVDYACKNISAFWSVLKSRCQPEMARVEMGLFSTCTCKAINRLGKQTPKLRILWFCRNCIWTSFTSCENCLTSSFYGYKHLFAGSTSCYSYARIIRRKLSEVANTRGWKAVDVEINLPKTATWKLSIFTNHFPHNYIFRV